MARYRRKIVNKRKVKRKKQEETNKLIKKMYILVGAIIAITFIVFSFSQRKSTENYRDIKENPNEYLVYTKYSDKETKYTKEIPYINLKSEIFKVVNQDIISFCEDYINREKSIITYEYDINGIILSVVIKIINNETLYAPEPLFRTYNINLDTEEVISDEALLEYFEVTKSNVEQKIKRKFEEYYVDIVKEEYYSAEECSYDCFLKYRGITKYTNEISYYIKDAKLIAYKPFIVHSIFGEEEYFNDKSFEFEIALTPLK